MVSRFSIRPLTAASLDSKTEQFLKANLNLYVAMKLTHQVPAKSNLRFERRCRLKNFKMTANVDVDSGTE